MSTQHDPIGEVVGDALAKIAEYRVTITYVGPGPGTPAFAYTAGLAAERHPELILAGGLHPQAAQAILNDLAFRVLDDGARLTHGDRLSDVIQGFDVVLCGPVDRIWRRRLPLSVAEAVYGRGQVTALQVVCPDAGGRFPWDPGYGMGVPLLAPPPPWAGGTPADPH